MKNFEYFKIYVCNPRYFVNDVKLFINRKYEKFVKCIFKKSINTHINILKKYFNIYENPMSIVSLLLEKHYDNIMYMQLKGMYAIYNSKKDIINIRIWLSKPGQIIGVGGFKFDEFKDDCEFVFEKKVELSIEEY